jgi:hypothetical protein
MKAGKVHTIADWMDLWVAEGGGSIMIKTREPHGDPVELSEAEGTKLVDCLRALIDQIR